MTQTALLQYFYLRELHATCPAVFGPGSCLDFFLPKTEEP
jgi:hypothetical protein